MKRTRKWSYVAQEALRLASLNLTDSEIADRLEVNRSTVMRWRQSGKLAVPVTTIPGAVANVGQSPDEWARDVRGSYALDSSDDQLVSGAVLALRTMYDDRLPIATRLNALRSYQGVLKQLNLVARRQPDEVPDEKPAALAERPMRRPGADPRNVLMAVK